MSVRKRLILAGLLIADTAGADRPAALAAGDGHHPPTWRQASAWGLDLVVRCCALVILALALPQQAQAATVRALFVGIDSYLYSGFPGTAANPPQFADLQGSIDDAIATRTALATTYHWNFDSTRAGSPCPNGRPGSTSRSVTLLDKCATHDAILGVLNALITQSQPGDTVLFYFAGHGAQIQSNGFDAKSTHMFDTIVPYDGRSPDDPQYSKDIRDDELNVIIENARNVQGANVITIFDSCHSGDADRDATPGARRIAMVTTDKPLPRPNETLKTRVAAVAGHRAHLAAAMDEEIAYESRFPAGCEGKACSWHGVFTQALMQAIAVTHGDALADILMNVQTIVSPDPATARQHPIGDGLQLTLDGRVTTGLVIPAAVGADGKVTLGDGRLANVTAKSAFALFATGAQARANTVVPLASGRVAAVFDNSATLTLDGPPAAPLPTSLFARETAHNDGATTVSVAIAVPDPVLHKAIMAQLAGVSLAATIDPDNKAEFDPAKAELVITLDPASHKLVVTTPAASGAAPTVLPPVSDPQFVEAVTTALAPRARMDELATLATVGGNEAIGFCVSSQRQNPLLPCKLPQAPIVQGKPAYLIVINNTSDSRFFYIYALAADNSVTLLTRQDAPVASGAVQAITLVPDFAGKIRFLVLGTKDAINGAALEQDGGARDASACANKLECLLYQANSRSRDPVPVEVGEWVGIINTVDVNPGPPAPANGG